MITPDNAHQVPRAGFLRLPTPDLLSAAADGRLLALAEEQDEKARRRAAFIEDLEFMISTGESTEGAASRFGILPDSLHTKLTDPARHLNRPDLWEALRENEIRHFGTTLGDLLAERTNQWRSRARRSSGVAA